MGGPAHPPADDATGISVDDEGHVDESRPGADVGEVRQPEPVRCRGMEHPVHMVERASCRLILHRGADGLAADDTVKAEVGHQAFDGAARDAEAFAQHLTPDLACSIDLEVLGDDALDLGLHRKIPLRPRRELLGIDALGDVVPVGLPGNRQHLADRLDPMDLAVIVNERDHRLSGRSSSAWAE